MARDPQEDALVADLRALGSSLQAPPPAPHLADAVLARLPAAPAAPARRTGTRRRVLVLVVLALLASLAAPPVRATVADWFRFAGVDVRIEPRPAPSAGAPPVTASPPPAVGRSIPLEQARGLVRFAPVVPAALGAPDRVDVSPDRRILSMTWATADGPVRLDQFDGQLDGAFAKTAPGAEYTMVAGSFALWFDEPHEVVVLAADGTPRTESARLAGNTLIWERHGTTLRLEGDLTLERAVTIAASSRPLP